ncbi:MAG: hypothetical protein LBK41_01725 [Clostridiales bacterium]|nr:hypothetical protein [Clostridiales bacterium]
MSGSLKLVKKCLSMALAFVTVVASVTVISGVVAPLPEAQAASYTVTLNGSNVDTAKTYGDGLTFKGFGVLSGNSTSNLLLDYKSEHPDKYWELIETLFGGDHPIMTHVKIEMGNDGNNSTGADAATMRGSETFADASRSPGLVLAADAKRVNPNVKVSGLRWNVPQGVAAGQTDSFYNWYRQTIFDCYEKYGYIWDYIDPDTNETGTPATALILWFKNKLVNEADFPAFFDQAAKDAYHNIKIVASDENNGSGSPIAIANSMNSNSPSGIRDAVDAIGSHYSRGNNESTVRGLVTGYSKEAWYSEASASFSRTEYQENQTSPTYGAGSIGGKSTPLSAVDTWLSMLVNEYKTHAIFQPAIAAFYHSTQYDYKQYIEADEPWAGYIHYDESMYMLKHFTDFTTVGWTNNSNGKDVWMFVPSASTNTQRPSGGHSSNEGNGQSNATFAAPDKSAFTTVIVNNSATENTYTINFSNMSLPAGSRYYIWRTTKDGYMQPQNSGGTAISGSSIANISVPAFSCVTVTTLDTAPDLLPADPESLPLDSGATGRGFDTSDDILYFDDFEYADEPMVPITINNGAGVRYVPYLESRGNEPRYMVDGSGAFQVEGGVLKQMNTESVGQWNPNTPVTRFGDHRWMNYTASVDVTPASSGAAVLGVRNQVGQGQGGSGYRISITRSGTWTTYDSSNNSDNQRNTGSVTAAGTYNLRIVANGATITYYVGNTQVDSFTDTSSPSLFGRCILAASGWDTHSYDNVKVEKIDGQVPYATKFIDDAADAITYSGTWTHRVVEGDSNNNHHRTSSWNGAANATATFTIDGTGFALIGPHSNTNNLTYQVDGGTATAKASHASYNRGTFFEVTGLTNGEHTIRLTFPSNLFSSGDNLDGVYVIGGSAQYGSIRASEADADIPQIAAVTSDSWAAILGRLPQTVSVTYSTGSAGSSVDADVTWDPIDVSGLRYENAVIRGAASYAAGGNTYTCDVYARCEVVDPETIIFANLGTDGVLANSAAGSAAYTQVKALLGAQLLNGKSDQAASGGFGYAGSPLAKSGFNQYSDKYDTQLRGAADSNTSSFTYQIPFPEKYAYKGALGFKTPWANNNRTITVTLEVGGATYTLAPAFVLGGSNVTRAIVEFSDVITSGAATGTLTVSASNQNQAPMLSWIEVSKDYDVDQPMITTFKFGAYDGVINQSAGTITVTLPPTFGSVTSVTPVITTSEGTVDKTGPQDFTNPVTYMVANALGTKSKQYVVTVIVEDLTLTSVAGGLEAVYATYPAVGAGALPSTVQAATSIGTEVTANVTWNAATYTVYETLTVTGTASYAGASNTLNVSAKVEVVPVGLVYFINAGTYGNSTVGRYYTWNSATQQDISVGSDVYDAAKALVGSQLKNNYSDGAYATIGSWGWINGGSGYVSPSTESGTVSYSMDKKMSLMHKQSNNYYFEYRFNNIPYGTYTVAYYVNNSKYGANDNVTITPYNNTTAGTVVTQNASTGQKTATVRLDEDGYIIIRFTQNTGAVGVSWIEISDNNAVLDVNPDSISAAAIPQLAAYPDSSASVLPATVKVSGYKDNEAYTNQDAAIDWGNVSFAGHLWENYTVTGTASYGGLSAQVTAQVEVIPRDTVYYILAGFNGQSYTNKNGESLTYSGASHSYGAIAALAAGLRNDAPDAAWNASKGWGYTHAIGTDQGSDVDQQYWGDVSIKTNTRLAADNDKNRGGYWAFAANDLYDGDIKYDLTLDRGSYNLTTNHPEFWGQTANYTRGYFVTVYDDEDGVLAQSASITDVFVSSTSNFQHELSFDVPEGMVVSVVISTDTSDESYHDPTLAWLNIAKTGDYIPPDLGDPDPADDYYVNTVWNRADLAANQTLTATTYFTNSYPGADAAAGRAIIALYNGGRLVMINSRTFSVDGGSTGKIDVSLTLPADVPSGASAALYLWDDQYAPIAAPALFANAAVPDALTSDWAALALTPSPDAGSLGANLTLPAAGAGGSVIAWKSTDPASLTTTGYILAAPGQSAVVDLVAIITNGERTVTKAFTYDVVNRTDYLAATAVLDNITLDGDYQNFAYDAALTTSASGAAIVWSSSDASVMKDNGENAVTDGISHSVTMTVTVTKGTVTMSKAFVLNVVKPADYGYLFAYFYGNNAGEVMRLGFSRDGAQWTDLGAVSSVDNDFTPTIGSGHIRDPFIIKGQAPDGSLKYYMMATDLQVGVSNANDVNDIEGRSSNYQNRAIYTWESDDLISWSVATRIRVADIADYPFTKGSGIAWAPEAVWVADHVNPDKSAGAYMMYFTLNRNNQNGTGTYQTNNGNVIAYWFTRDFKTFEGQPQYLYSYEGNLTSSNNPYGGQTMDASIISYKVGNSTYYVMFYRKDTGTIYRVGPQTSATSWSETGYPVIAYGTGGAEGPEAFQLIGNTGTAGWVLTADHNFNDGTPYYSASVSTTDDVTAGQTAAAFTEIAAGNGANQTNINTFMKDGKDAINGTARHGGFITIDESRYAALEKKYLGIDHQY